MSNFDPTENCRLRIALGEMFRLIDEGWLVRNTENDHKPDWAMRQLDAVRRLASARQAYDMAREVK